MGGETRLARSLMRVFGNQAGSMAENYAVHQMWVGNRAGVERWRRVLALIVRSERRAARGQGARLAH